MSFKRSALEAQMESVCPAQSRQSIICGYVKSDAYDERWQKVNCWAPGTVCKAVSFGPFHICTHLPTADPHLRLCIGPKKSGIWSLPAFSSLHFSTEFRPSIDSPALPTCHATLQSQHLTGSANTPPKWILGVSACRKISSLLSPIVTNIFPRLLDSDLVDLGDSFALPMK